MSSIVKVLIFVVLSIVIGFPATAGLFFIIFVAGLIKKRPKRTSQPVYYVANQRYYF